MEVTVKLKHIIIPIIVIFVTIFGLIFELQNSINNPTLDVAFIYPGNGLTTHSEQKFIWETLNEVQNNYSLAEHETQYELISLEHLNVGSISESQLDSLASKNEIVILLGDSYNDELQQVLNTNKETYFVLIDSTMTTTYENVIHVNLDHSKEIKNAAQSLSAVSTTKQALYISLVPYDQNIDNYELFASNCNGCSVQYYHVVNPNDTVTIINDIKEFFTLGYDIAYVEDSSIYSLVVSAAKEVQIAIIEENKLVEENALKETPVEIEEVYIQDQIYIVGKYFDMYSEGIYEDTNLDLMYNELDKSVVLETYTYNLYATFNTIFTEVINGNIEHSSYNIEPVKVSDIKVETQGVNEVVEEVN